MKVQEWQKRCLQREELEKIPLLLYRQPVRAKRALSSMTEGFLQKHLSNFRFNLETSLLNGPNCHAQ